MPEQNEKDKLENLERRIDAVIGELGFIEHKLDSMYEFNALRTQLAELKSIRDTIGEMIHA